MAPKLQKKPNAYVPKKGKFRKAFKRPASVKSKEYNAVKYVRVPTPPAPRHRGEQAKWRRSLKDLLCATNKSIVDMLTKDKILPNWQGMQCPRCQKGTLSGLIDCPGGGSLKKYRCGYKKCQHYLNPHHLHPLFQECRGPQGHTLQVQAAVLLLKLAEVKNDKIHKLLDVNHKAVEDMDKRLSEVRRTWVEQKQKTMKVGDGTSWVDVEGDEATFCKTTVKDGDTEKPVKWEQWLGILERGRPESLILERLRASTHPGPSSGLRAQEPCVRWSGSRWRISTSKAAPWCSIRILPKAFSFECKALSTTTSSMRRNV